MIIRTATVKDLDEWARMRNLLWPDSVAQHKQELEKFFADRSIDIVQSFVLQRESERLAGFIEINERNYAEGCHTSPVAYLEAWFVDADCRGQGWGKKLIERAERWAIDQGYREIGSDTTPDNHNSIAAHAHLGYRETGRIVCFIKPLVSSAGR